MYICLPNYSTMIRAIVGPIVKPNMNLYLGTLNNMSLKYQFFTFTLTVSKLTNLKITDYTSREADNIV